MINKYENININNGVQLYDYVSRNKVGQNYYILNDVLYYSSEMDQYNITNL